MGSNVIRQTRFDIKSICLRRSSLLIVIGWSAFCILGIYGLANQEVKAGHVAGLVDRLLSQGYSLLLAGTLISAFVVTEEDRWQSFSQSLRISGGRRPLIASKLLTAVAVGAVIGVYAVALALVATSVVAHAKSVPVHLSSG